MPNQKQSTTKQGFKTTEFWLTILFTTLATVGPIVQHVSGPWAVLANSIVIGAYTLSRGKAKSVGVLLPSLMLMLGIALALPSCSAPYIDLRVDTTGAVATKPDADLDGIPDEILVTSGKVMPEINMLAIDELNKKAKDLILNGVDVIPAK